MQQQLGPSEKKRENILIVSDFLPVSACLCPGHRTVLSADWSIQCCSQLREMAFVGERHRLEGDISGGIFDKNNISNTFLSFPRSQGTPESTMDQSSPSEADAWSPKVSQSLHTLNKLCKHQTINLHWIVFTRRLDARGRQQIKKDCDEVFPQIIIGTGDCIKDVSCNQWKCWKFCPSITENFLFVPK